MLASEKLHRILLKGEDQALKKIKHDLTHSSRKTSEGKDGVKQIHENRNRTTFSAASGTGWLLDSVLPHPAEPISFLIGCQNSGHDISSGPDLGCRTHSPISFSNVF